MSLAEAHGTCTANADYRNILAPEVNTTLPQNMLLSIFIKQTLTFFHPLTQTLTRFEPIKQTLRKLR